MTSSVAVKKEREAFLEDPSLPHYGWDGSRLERGRDFDWLVANDPDFSHWLLSKVSESTDASFVKAALFYYSSISEDWDTFEQIVQSTKNEVMEKEVILGQGDVLAIVTLREWIEQRLKDANKSVGQIAGTGGATD